MSDDDDDDEPGDMSDDDDDEPGVPGLMPLPGRSSLVSSLYNNKSKSKPSSHQLPPWKKPAVKHHSLQEKQVSTKLFPVPQSMSPNGLPSNATSITSLKASSLNGNSITSSPKVSLLTSPTASPSRGTVSLTGEGEVRMVPMDLVGDSLISSHSLSSRIKQSFLRIQDIVGFMETETAINKQELVFNILEESTDLVRLNAVLDGSLETIGEGSCLSEAKEKGCRTLWSQSPSFIQDSVYQSKIESIKAVLAPGSSWSPAFDSRHVHVEGEHRPFYETEIFLGPLSVSSVHKDLRSSLDSSSCHLVDYLSTRDKLGMFEEPGRSKHRYVAGRNIIEMRTESHRKDHHPPPPIDLAVVQPHLPMGVFPPSYGYRDSRGWVRIFYCKVCKVKLTGAMILDQHVTSRRHTVRLGRVMVNDMLKETFNPNKLPKSVEKKPNCKKCGCSAVIQCRHCEVDLCGGCREDHDSIAQNRVHDMVEMGEEVHHRCSRCEERKIEVSATAKCDACERFLCGNCEYAHGRDGVTKSHLLVKIKQPSNWEGPSAKQEHLVMAYIGDIIGPMMYGSPPPWACGPWPGLSQRGRGRGRARDNFSHPYRR